MAEDEPPPIEIAGIKAGYEAPDGTRVQLEIHFANGPDSRGEERRLHRELQERIRVALDTRSMGSGPDGKVSVQVPRDRLEESVRAIRRAVAEFNEVYPSLLAEHRREVAHRDAEAEAWRQADQAIIDHVMNSQ